jgi:hypothetical protein
MAMLRFPSFAIALAAALPALAQMNLSGKVTDVSGKGIAGVTVALRKAGISTLTAADGSYALDGTAALMRPDGSGPGGLAFRDGRLEFRVDGAARKVRIEAFDLAGRSAGALLDAELARGTYRVDPFASSAPGDRLLLLSVRLGPDGYLLKLVRTGARGPRAAGLSRLSLSSAALAKGAAALGDTLVASKAGYDDSRKSVASLAGRYDFLLVDPDEFWGKPSDYPVAKNVMTYVFLNRTNGKYADDRIYWTFNGQTKTLAEQNIFDMPANASGRVTFHLESPTGPYWDFMEHTITATNWYGNTTRVDAYGLPIAIRLICGDGTDTKLGELYDVFYMGRDAFFQAYKAAVPAEFQHTADTARPYRIVAPGKGDGGFGPGERYGTYYDAYLKELGLPATDTRKVFACEGDPFGSDARLAAAVNRHVAHLPRSEWAKAENFYRAAPADYYAKFFHDFGFGGKAYGFAYDDAEGFAAYTACARPKTLIIAVGF